MGVGWTGVGGGCWLPLGSPIGIVRTGLRRPAVARATPVSEALRDALLGAAAGAVTISAGSLLAPRTAEAAAPACRAGTQPRALAAVCPAAGRQSQPHHRQLVAGRGMHANPRWRPRDCSQGVLVGIVEHICTCFLCSCNSIQQQRASLRRKAGSPATRSRPGAAAQKQPTPSAKSTAGCCCVRAAPDSLLNQIVMLLRAQCSNLPRPPSFGSLAQSQPPPLLRTARNAPP